MKKEEFKKHLRFFVIWLLLGIISYCIYSAYNETFNFQLWIGVSKVWYIALGSVFKCLYMLAEIDDNK